MAGPLIVDTHAHAFDTAADASALVDGYAPEEYGPAPGRIQPPAQPGTIDGLLAAMAAAGVSRAVLLHTWLGGLERLAHPESTEDEHAAKLAAQNRHVCAIAQRHPALVAFVAVDMRDTRGARLHGELEELRSLGARGVKVHPSLERVAVDDPSAAHIWTVCADLGLPVVAHGGQTHHSSVHHAEPRRFAGLLRARPDLRTVVAHVGGAEWRSAPSLADACPNVAFDLCEIIQYVGAPHAPTLAEFGRLVSDIGSDRVLFGTDFPWYGLDDTVDRVMAIPGLSADEKEGILGRNAESFLRL